MGSLRERPPGSGRWQLRAYAGRDVGRDIYVTRTFVGTERAARKELARLEVELEDRRAPRPGQGSVAELLEDWWMLKDWQSAGSRRQARSDLDRYLLPKLGPIHLARLDHDPIDRLYQSLLNGNGSITGRPLGRGTVRRLHATLHAALAWGVKKGRLGVNPAARATPPTPPPSAVRAPEPWEVRDLLAAAAPVEFAAFLRLAAATGRRRGDLLGLQVPDVHDNVVVFTRRAVLGDCRIVIEDLDKNRRATRLEIDDATAAVLRTHLTWMRERALALGTGLTRRAFVFSDAADGSVPWRPDSTSRKFRLLAGRVGLDDLTLHGLRHAHVTELLTAGIDVETVARRVGDDPRTIYRVYSHFRPAADRRAAHAWGELMGGDPGRVSTLREIVGEA